MHREPSQSPLIRWRRQNQSLYDGIVLILYTLVVYGWTLTVPALGRDYAHLANPDALPGLLGGVVAAMGAAFDGRPVPYRLVNLTLLYACMLLVYRFTNHAVRGPQWLGNLAAVLFMANPVHTEAVMNLTGAVDLLPALATLAALTSYAWQTQTPGPMKSALTGVLFLVAAALFPSSTFLFLVAALFEWLVVRRPGAAKRLILPFVSGIIGLILHGETFRSRGFDLGDMWAPLYFIFYPIGFLPETVLAIQQRPWLGWLAALTVAVVLLLIYRRARHPAILFGILAMLALRLAPPDRPVDFVHLVGGGQLLVENGLFNIALVALFLRIMDHPRWRSTVVAGTTVLAAVFFVMQIRSNLAWKHAGEEVVAFQRQAAAVADAGDGPVGVLPDYRYYLTAPVRLSESVSYDTPFSREIPHVSLLELNRLSRNAPELEVLSWGPEEGLVALDRETVRAALAPDFRLLRPGAPIETSGAVVERVEDESGRVVLRLLPREDALPVHIAPAEP